MRSYSLNFLKYLAKSLLYSIDFLTLGLCARAKLFLARARARNNFARTRNFIFLARAECARDHPSVLESLLKLSLFADQM